MQGVGKDDKGVLVLGATNLPWALDPAIRRRFERRIYIPLPEFEARLGMLKRGMKDNKHSLTEDDFKELGMRTENFSGSDVSILVRDAVYAPVRLLQTATKFKEVNGKFQPCRPNESGQPGTWMDFPREKV
jgi:vacuolar protein-sorting-associated protein 4